VYLLFSTLLHTYQELLLKKFLAVPSPSFLFLKAGNGFVEAGSPAKQAIEKRKCRNSSAIEQDEMAPL
jgi:hypothetical protein